MNQAEVGQIIQSSLAPGIMISSSGLFLLGLQTRFSNLFSRFRALNQERRALELAGPEGKERHESVIRQLDGLLKRVRAVKNAILFLYAGIFCFIAASLSLFLAYTPLQVPGGCGFAAFFAGMLFICCAVFFMVREILFSFHILRLERNS